MSFYVCLLVCAMTLPLFQRLMQVVLVGIEWKFCFVYLDDILVCSETFEEHMEHLKRVFEQLRSRVDSEAKEMLSVSRSCDHQRGCHSRP